jgi:hypothetical protein
MARIDAGMRLPQKIISGGQAGADRGALDFAMVQGVNSGGFCPRGRRAEDGPIPARYTLTELGSPDYPPRTQRNVAESDATVIFNRGQTDSRGTSLTARCAKEAGKPFLVIRGCEEVAAGVDGLAAFLSAHKPVTLNVAGNSESKAPGMSAYVVAVLSALWARQKSLR